VKQKINQKDVNIVDDQFMFTKGSGGLRRGFVESSSTLSGHACRFTERVGLKSFLTGQDRYSCVRPLLSFQQTEGLRAHNTTTIHVLASQQFCVLQYPWIVNAVKERKTSQSVCSLTAFCSDTVKSGSSIDSRVAKAHAQATEQSEKKLISPAFLAPNRTYEGTYLPTAW